MPPSSLSRRQFLQILLWSLFAVRPSSALAKAVPEAEEYGNYDYFSAAHVFGTCRMGNDPKDSVVDANCRSLHWRNLFICDASVFPSSGGGEAPSLTIEAIALRAADHILDLARNISKA